MTPPASGGYTAGRRAAHLLILTAMRLPLAFATLALVAGCRASVTGPHTPAGPPPSGLAVSLGITPSYAAPAPAPSVEAAGDSVVVAAVLGSSGCADYAAQAGRDGDSALVVTIVSTPNKRPCLLGMFQSTFRAAVGQARRGRYDVVLRQRFESAQQAPQELEVVRRSVTLR